MINVDTEQALQELGHQDSSQPSEEAVQVNELRSSLIRVLKKREAELLKKLPVALPTTSDQVYAGLELNSKLQTSKRQSMY